MILVFFGLSLQASFTAFASRVRAERFRLRERADTPGSEHPGLLESAKEYGHFRFRYRLKVFGKMAFLRLTAGL
jgi:hypothetical protein